MRAVRLVLFSSLSLTGFLPGCHRHPQPDTSQGFAKRAVSLKGTYGAARKGLVEPVLKVEETKAGYQFEERTTGEWKLDSQVPRIATEDEVKRTLGLSAITFPVFGLATDSVWLLKVPSGWTGMGVTTKTGYLLVSEGKLAAAEKVELGSR